MELSNKKKPRIPPIFTNCIFLLVLISVISGYKKLRSSFNILFAQKCIINLMQVLLSGNY